MDFSSLTNSTIQPLLGPGGIKIDPDFIKREPDYLKIDPDFEPQTRARSNTWPHSRPEDPPLGGHSSCPPPLPENDVMTQGLLGFPKKSTSRRNAWGNLSYADLITQAIQSSPDKRLTLSQIYDWMVTNVPYFKDKGDSNSSAGWKNSIRHNLSLHNRFMRVQNEGTGKSSWWMLNPDAKPGKAARRRATSMETSKFEKKRGRIKKKLEAMRNGLALDTPSPASSLSEGLDLFPESPHVPSTFSLSPSDFRNRANSNASSCAGRLSPILGEVVDIHDSSVPPMSNWEYNYPYGSPTLVDRFGTDQLAVGVANTLKLHENTGSYDFHQQNYSSAQNFGGSAAAAVAAAGAGVQATGFRRSPAAIPTTIRQNEPSQAEAQAQLLNGIYGATYPSSAASFLQQTATQHQPTSQDSSKLMSSASTGHHSHELDFNLDLDPNTFECNVDEVLQAELSLGEGIDFNFGQTNGANHLHQNPNVSVPNSSSSYAQSPPYASAVVVHHQQPTSGRQWTSVLH